MGFDSGDTAYEDADSTVDSEDFDSSDMAGDADDDASWAEASEMNDSDFNAFLSDDGESSDPTAAEVAFEPDASECDGQLSLFEADDEPADEADLSAVAPSLEAEAVLADAEEPPTENSDAIEGQVDVEEFLEYQEDLRHTPAYESSLGQWSGMRGDSLFIPSDAEAQQVLSALGLEGIPYHEARPDFTSVSAATIYLSPDDMALSDAMQKSMAAFTLADDLVDEEMGEIEDASIENVDTAVIESVLADDVDEFYGALLSGEVPASFVWHHGDVDIDGDYPYLLIPASIHDACLHRGGRSHSGTKR